MKKLLAALLLTISAASHALALDVPIPPLSYIRDDADIFTDEFELELNQTIAEIESTTTSEIAILTLSSLKDEALEPFAVEVFREWGIGQTGIDNGLLLLIAIDDRAIRIEVGYGLEGRITDYTSDQIIDDYLAPAFQAGDYESGVRDAVTELGKYINEEYETYGFDEYTYDDTEMGYFYSKTTEDIITAGIIVFVVAIFIYAFFAMFEEKKANKLRKMPLMQIVTLIISFAAGLGFWGVIAGLGFATIMQVIFLASKISFTKTSKWHAGTSGSSKDDDNHWGSSGGSASSSSGSSSSSQSFGGGSTGGGGASGNW